MLPVLPNKILQDLASLAGYGRLRCAIWRTRPHCRHLGLGCICREAGVNDARGVSQQSAKRCMSQAGNTSRATTDKPMMRSFHVKQTAHENPRSTPWPSTNTAAEALRSSRFLSHQFPGLLPADRWSLEDRLSESPAFESAPMETCENNAELRDELPKPVRWLSLFFDETARPILSQLNQLTNGFILFA